MSIFSDNIVLNKTANVHVNIDLQFKPCVMDEN
jgi:hypothetical protein